jgi:3D (Asp-Asp-Asp) domain-containing protein
MPYVLVEEVKVDEQVGKSERNTADNLRDSDNGVYVLYEVTAYTSGLESTGKHPNDPAYGITASGEHVREGVTVACPPSMAFGTRLEIEGVGERVCADRGSKITEGRLDIYFTNVKEAIKFGRRELRARILRSARDVE